MKPETASAILITHFQAARDDIQRWVDRRDRYAILTAVACGSIGYFAVSLQEDSAFLLLIPVLVYVSSRMICHAELLIGSLVQYLRMEYESEVTAIVGRPLTHWDTSTAAQAFASKASFFNRNAAIGFIYFVACWVAGAYRFGDVFGNNGPVATGTFFEGLLNLFLEPSPAGIVYIAESVIFCLTPFVSYLTIRTAVRRRAKWFAEASGSAN
ncbi:hypothetical protein ACWCOP_09230 [Maricaulaceae bacterium MS644]